VAGDGEVGLFARLVSALKLRVDEGKTVGTWFVPTDRVSLLCSCQGLWRCAHCVQRSALLAARTPMHCRRQAPHSLTS
jgi:hypothetical protein